MFLIAEEGTFVSISIGVEIFSFSSAFSIEVVSTVLIAIGVDGLSLSVIIS